MSKVYEYVKENLLKKLEEAIEKGDEFQWIKPWNGYLFPMRFSSKEPYRGINLITLSKTGYYLTLNEIKKNKGRLKKGAKSEAIYFWQFNEKQNDKEIDESTIEMEEKKNTCIFKYYRVFHQSDIEGIEFPKPKTLYELGEENNLAEKIIKKYSEEIVPIKEIDGSNDAYYSMGTDEIYIPKRKQFKSNELFYGVVFHEMTHSTGHESRLNRLKGSKFGDIQYSKEELVAEIGSALLSAYCGLKNQTIINNNIAYLKSWYENIKEEGAKELTIAGQKAQKAMDFIIEKTILEESKIA